MVPTNKMVQPSHRLVQYLLLCLFWQLGFASPGGTQYSSIRIQSPDKGEIVLFLINVLVTKVGKKLDNGYRCPVYCGVDHKHIYWKKDETEKSNVSPDDGLPGSSKPEDREQSEGNLRPISSNN